MTNPMVDKYDGPAGSLGSGPEQQTAVFMSRVGYSYPNGVVALSDVDLRVIAGSVLGVIGPSGCGKSTLLQLIAGLALPTEGELETLRDPGVSGCPLAMVFQRDTLLPWLTVRENVGLYARLSTWGGRSQRRESTARVSELLAMVGLELAADRYPYQLSGGMRRRVAFASAVAPLPRILLLDEPFSSVDEPTRIQIHAEVRKVIDRYAMTVILVTHDLAEAISLSDRVAVMTQRPGRIFREFPIDLGRERDVFALRDTPRFLELYGEAWATLAQQITRVDHNPD